MIVAETVPFSGSEVHDRWRSLEHRSKISTAFSSETYISALAEIMNLPAEATLLSNEGRDIAGVVLLKSKSGPLERVVPAPLTPFSTVAAECLPAPADVHAHSSWLDVLSISLVSQYSTIDLMLPPPFLDVRALQWHNWSASPLYTFHLKISDEESSLSRWSESTLRRYKKYQGRFSLRSDRTDISAIVRLCREGYSRHKKNAPLSEKQMTRFAERLVEAGKAQCWSVIEDGSDTISAGIVSLRQEKTAVYWIAGSVPGPGMTVLIGRIMSELYREGVTVLDFVGANTPTIAEFKRRFNPELKPYFRVRHTRNGWLELMQSAVRVFRR